MTATSSKVKYSSKASASKISAKRIAAHCMLSQDVVENQKRVKDARKSMLDKTTGKEPTLESAISHSRVISTDMASQGLEDKEEPIKQALPSNNSSAVPSQKSVISNGNQPSSTGCLDKESGQSDDSVISGAMKTLSLDDNSSSKRSRVESLQQAQDPNQIPDGFISDVQDPMRYFFLGYYAGDGCFGRHFLRRFRIILKACEFVPLYKMLARCGVASPDFRFMKQNYISVKYSAGYAGSVRWSPKSSRESSSSISDLGLPSSGAVCSDVGLLKSLIPDTDPEEKSQLFLLLILGYTVADGTVIWKYRRTAQGIFIRYGGIQLYSTDLGFLQWACKELIVVGMDAIRLGAITRRANHTDDGEFSASQGNHRGPRRTYALSIQNTARNNSTFKLALDFMRQNTIPLDGKLEFLSDFLQNNCLLPVTVLQARSLSFYDYVGKNINDPVSCVIAQDLHSLHLHSLNIMLMAVGFRNTKLQSIYDFDLTSFLVFIKNLGQTPETPLQDMLRRYYHNCKCRVANVKIKNYMYKQPYSYSCKDCPETFSHSQLLNAHWALRHHADTSIRCKYDCCDAKVASLYRLKQHYENFHIAEQEKAKLELVCPQEGCNSEKLFKSKTELRHHILLHHTSPVTERNAMCSFVSCNKSFRTYAQLNRHQLECHVVHDAQNELLRSSSKLICSIAGCTKSYADIRALMRHRYHKHPECSISCTVCGSFKTSSTESLARHMDSDHNPMNQFVCEISSCKRRFRYESCLANHRRRAQH